jgi:hypothetical protein
MLKTPLRNAMIARGDRLAEFLNYEGVDAQTAVDLLEQLTRMQKVLDGIIQKERYIVRQTVPPEEADRMTGLYCLWAADKKVSALLRLMNRRLGKHGWKVNVMVELNRRGPPTVPLVPKRRPSAVGPQPFGYMLRDCAEDRSLEWVRRCKVCEQWFMAGRVDQLHCGRRCSKQAFQRRDPKKWAKYMKEYRALKRSGATK